MRVFGGAERAIGALVEREGGPKRRNRGRRVDEAEIPRIKSEIQRLLRSIRQVEAIADAMRFAHATSL
jgi:hypothetical protein